MAATIRVQVRGERDEIAMIRPAVGGPFADIVRSEIKDAVRLERGRAELPTVVTGPISDDDVVEVELEDGLKLWVRGSEIEAELGAVRRRGVDADVVEIPDALPRRSLQRGVGTWLLKGLRIIKVDPAEATAKLVADRLEQRLVPQPGLYRWNSEGDLAAVGERDLKGQDKLLLFLHGTASKTLGSFGGLIEDARQREWQALRAAYGERVFALEHKTLSASPIENACDVLEGLPENAPLHLVSHSRGGLIGELLCRGHLVARDEAFTAEELALLEESGHRERLVRLGELLQAKRPRVERFVRVACPARGTILASERLDRYLSVLANLLGLIPGLAGNPIYDFVKAFLFAVIKERTDPETIPGLEAMMPESPFQKLINRPQVTSSADLSVIKGDLEGEGIFTLSRLKALATDLYYREDHDLVVNTSAMDGGTPRQAGTRVFFDQGPLVDHFAYFRNERTAAQLVRGLLRKDDDPAGFEPVKAVVERAIPRGPIVGRGDRQPTVFVLPGLTGTLLDAQGQRIWIDLPQLAIGGLGRLEIGDPGIEPSGLVNLYYGDLIEHLSASHAVIPFPYDWRRSIRDEAARFADAVDERLRETERPVRIVAHSMGGLVARAALAEAPGVWQRFKERDGSRLVLLGVPNGGSHSIPLLVMGRDQTMKMLAALDFTMSRRQHLAIVSAYPGLLELLPRDPSLDLFAATGWAELQANDGDGAAGWITPQTDDLASAAAFRARLEAAPVDVERMLYIAGQNVTVDGIMIDRQRRRAVFTRTNEGDGRVPWRTGILPGMRAWYTDAAHGDLARHRPAFAAIVDLLERGTTTKLPTTPPATRDLEAPAPIEAERMEVFPDGPDLMAAAMGARITGPAAIRRVEPMRLAVAHGNLAFARYPLMVGHYRGDTFAGAEAHLDLMLDGRLTEWRELGLYPGEIGTAEVIMDSGADHARGAIVVGLGDANRLAEGELERTLTRGLLRYAAVEREQRRARATDGGASRIGVSCLLVGSGEGGLSVAACVKALLLALKSAQRALGEGGFDEIEIVELYEHRAIQIWHEIERAKSTPGLDELFRLEPEVRRGEGGRRRVAEEEDRTWWQPVNIVMEQTGREEPRMTFTVATGMARAEAAVLPTNKAFVDRFIRQAIAHPDLDPERGTPGRALFELLVPEHLKERTRDDRPLRLILDPGSAAYPWELMDDRRPWVDGEGPSASDRDPPALRAKLIRQLVRQTFRERVVRPLHGRGKAIVIGDPRGDPTGHYAPLDGAIDEARAVADLLDSRGFEVTRLIGKEVSADQVVMALCAQDWRIVHVAAHGVLAGNEGEATGVVLGRDMILTAAMLGQLLPVTPDLVFVNCCHLGAIDPTIEERAQPSALAASVAVKLIDIGVSAVVAAGWAVDDRPAQRFAQTFYEAILDNETFGEAVLRARRETHASARGSSTWGAYQCYGEGDWRLDLQRPGGPAGQRGFGSIVEVINLVDEIRQDAQTGMARDAARQTMTLDALVHAAKERGWDSDPELLTALGRTYGELGDLAQAIEFYMSALACEQAATPLSTIEKLANLTVRSAVREARRSGAEDLDQLVRDQVGRLELLEQLAGPTVERYALRGSCFKRLAQVVRREARTKALEDMADAYEKGEARAREQTGKIDPYPCLMLVTARIANGWRQPGRPNLTKVRRLISDAERASAERDRTDPRFWHGTHKADALLLRQLAEGDLGPDQQAKIAAAYVDSWRRGGSRLKLDSVLEQLDFFIHVWSDEDGEQHRAKRQHLNLALAELRDTLVARTQRGA
jgi:pimeloyl-ACP methyl ester carboxylesterase